MAKKKLGGTSVLAFLFDTAEIPKNEFPRMSVQDGIENPVEYSNMEEHRPVDRSTLFDNPFENPKQ